MQARSCSTPHTQCLDKTCVGLSVTTLSRKQPITATFPLALAHHSSHLLAHACHKQPSIILRRSWEEDASWEFCRWDGVNTTSCCTRLCDVIRPFCNSTDVYTVQCSDIVTYHFFTLLYRYTCTILLPSFKCCVTVVCVLHCVFWMASIEILYLQMAAIQTITKTLAIHVVLSVAVSRPLFGFPDRLVGLFLMTFHLSRC